MNTIKKLPLSTIIPTDFYVERAADRQLKSIIDDMGRPGYVLVARQMGKTNLLIHMKRTRKDDLVLYKDLSSQFETPRAFFRDIIDSILESFPELAINLPPLSTTEDSSTQPNIEYDRNLRTLLKNTDKKIIIVLDEIDSLVNSSFSDVIFAQIRSMYFSRINFPEYERLTYVLSGVAEPTDLIKNKNISPFNIGEKIYLEDFDRSEYENFLKKSGLSFPEAVKDKIYDWTAGNPRTTWDICSEIVDLLLAGETINPDTVNRVIEKLYLHDFDRAPIDHIRTLVESDKIIRDAIISIRWGKSSFIDDKTKSKLYLSGITRSAGGEASIKNKIIDEALSDSWIKSVTPTATNPILLALSYYSFGDHLSAISIFESIKSDPTLDTKLNQNQRLTLATSYLWINKPDKAIDEFRICLKNSTSTPNRQNSELRVGNTLAYFNEYVSAVEFFKAASEGPSVLVKYNAQLSLAETYRVSGIENNEETLKIIENLLEKLDTPENLDSESGRSIYVAACLCRARILMESLDYSNADITLQKAFPMAAYSAQAKLLLTRYDCITDNIEREDILVQICSIVMDNQVVTTTFSGADLNFDNKQIVEIMVRLYEQSLFNLMHDFIEYVHKTTFSGNLSIVDTILTCFYSIPSKEDRAKNIDLLKYCESYVLDESSASSAILKIYRELSSNSPEPESMMWRIRYLDEIQKHSDFNSLIEDDIKSLTSAAYHLRKQKNYDQLERLYDFWEKIQDKACELTIQWSVYVAAHGMFYYQETRNTLKSRSYATSIISKIELNEKELLSSGSASQFMRIRDQAEALLRLRVEHDPYRNYGRNEKIYVKYGDKEPALYKFKQIKDDLANGKCSIIENKK